MSYRAYTALFATAALVTAAARGTQRRDNTPPNWIGYHEVKTDAGGRIVPWYGSGPSQAYDHVVRLVFGFWTRMRECTNGVPYYLQHQVWKPDADDQRGLGGDQIPMALSSWHLLYGYLGDPAVKDNMILMADYWLAHGMSKPEQVWGNLPYPYNLNIHSGVYDGDMRAGKGFLQPDKAASFGAELVVLYKMTGERKYLDAAVRMADKLAAKVKPGDAENSPWPFRVNAETGAVHQDKDRSGKTFTASYMLPGLGTGDPTTGDAGLVIDIPGICIAVENYSYDDTTQALTVRAAVMMMCGCKLGAVIGNSSPWPPADFNVQLVVGLGNSETQAYSIAYSGAPSIYDITQVLPAPPVWAMITV